MSAQRAGPPNILFLLSDDQGAWALGCAGNRELATPNLDRLAASGTRFDRFFCVSPVCSPARATLMTGRIPSRHGVHDWIRAGNTDGDSGSGGGGEPIEFLEGQPAYTDRLAEAGVVCGLSGKWHLGASARPQKGIRFWEVHAKGGGPYYGAPLIRDGRAVVEPRYVTEVFTDRALAFLESRRGRAEPFHLGVHYTAPHQPWTRGQHPPEFYGPYFRDCAFESVPRGRPPAWVRHRSLPVDSEDVRRAHLSGYYAAVTAMDRQIGRLLDALDANGWRENTLVVFTSDNGMLMGHHGLFGKGNASFPLNLFEESVRVPFLVSMPGTIPAGRVCSSLYSQYDVMPTLLDFAGIRNPEADSLPGKSFLNVLLGGSEAGGGPLVVFDEYGPVRMIRTERWKYVHRYPYGPHELHDLDEDPGEEHNREGDPACRGILRELKADLREWFLRYSDPARDGLCEPVTGCGQIGRCGLRAAGRPAFSRDRVGRLFTPPT